MVIDEPSPPARLNVSRGEPSAIVHELPAAPESVAIARSLVTDAFGEELGDRRDDVLLAVSEAVTNAIRHGYRGTPGLISIGMRQTRAGRLRITVGDQGLGLDRPSVDPGLGLGIELIRRVADAAAFRAGPDGGTVAEMEFAVDGRCPVDD